MADNNQALKAAVHAAAVETANREPLPGALKEAFGGEIITASGIKVRPVVAYDFIVLEKLGSFIYRQMMSLDAEQVKPTPSEIIPLCWMFTRPASEVKKVMAGGVDAAKSAAEDYATELSFSQLTEVFEAVFNQFGLHNSTQVAFGSSEGEKKTISVDTVVSQKTD